jgi:hypothetical protein
MVRVITADAVTFAARSGWFRRPRAFPREQAIAARPQRHHRLAVHLWRRNLQERQVAAQLRSRAWSLRGTRIVSPPVMRINSRSARSFCLRLQPRWRCPIVRFGWMAATMPDQVRPKPNGSTVVVGLHAEDLVRVGTLPHAGLHSASGSLRREPRASRRMRRRSNQSQAARMYV